MKQQNIPGLGAFVEALYMSLPILSVINFVSIAIVLYSDIRPYLLEHLPWVQLWMFLLALSSLVFISMLLVYKFVLPSIWTFRGKQMFEHESEVMDSLKRIEGQLNKGESVKDKQVAVAVAGGFDPIHPGHIAYINEALKLGTHLLVILTRDEQLMEKDRIAGNKKNRLPIPYAVRKATLEWGLGDKGEVVENIDRDITSRESLKKYHPDIFAKGGDSWDLDNLPEKSVCDELGIKIVFGVGGYDKPYSSSKLGVGKK